MADATSIAAPPAPVGLAGRGRALCLRGLTTRDVASRCDGGPIHPADLPTVQLAVKRAVRGGGPADAEYRRQRADGSYHPVRGRVLPTRDAAGRVVGWTWAAEPGDPAL